MSYLDYPHCYLLFIEKWGEPGHRIISTVYAVYTTVEKARAAADNYERTHWPEGISEGWRTMVYLFPLDPSEVML